MQLSFSNPDNIHRVKDALKFAAENAPDQWLRDEYAKLLRTVESQLSLYAVRVTAST